MWRQHDTVRWEAGELIAVDHDNSKRRAAHGGEPVPCLELLRVWSRQCEDQRVLTLASRGATDPVNIEVGQLRFGNGPRRQTEEQTLRPLAGDGRLPDRLQGHDRGGLGPAPGNRARWASGCAASA